MKNLIVFVLFYLACITISAQKLEIWKNLTNTNDVRKIAVAGNNLWAVTSGGLYKYNISTKEIVIFTKSENLSSQDLTALAIDNKGMIWVGSREGYINILNPSDGSVRKIFDIYNASKSQKGINDLTISGDTLFVSHDFGLSFINTATFGFMDNVIKFGSLPTESKVISISRFSKIYACLSAGMAIQKSGTTNLFAPDSWDTFTNSFLSLNKSVLYKNEIYVATNTGLYKFNNGTFTAFAFQNEKVIDLSVQGTNLYILTSSNLYKYSTSTDTPFSSEGTTHILSSLAVSADNIFIASNKGISAVSSSGTTKITTNSPVTNTFMNMDLDSLGNLWVGTGKDAYGKGVMNYSNGIWTNFYNANETSLANDYHNVYAGGGSKVYWMNWGGGFATCINNQIALYNTTNTPMLGIKDAPNFLVISDIKNDSKGNTWFVNLWPVDKNVLWQWKPDKTWQPYTFSSITSAQLFYKLVIDKNSTKWISVSANIDGGDKGLIAFNESTTNPIYHYYSMLDGLNSDIVNSLTIDLRGYIWIGTSSGINYIQDPSKPKIIAPYNPGIKYQYVTCIAVDALDQKWVGTKAGLFVLSPDCMTQIEHYDISSSSLPTNEISSIAIDKKKGIIYIGTDYGLTVLKTDFVQPNESFSEIVTFPSPYVVGDGKGTLLKIDGLVRESSIKILALTGQLVSDFKSSGGRIAFWDGKDQNGQYVSSGVYFVVAYDQEGNNVAKGKIAVIKK